MTSNVKTICAKDRFGNEKCVGYLTSIEPVMATERGKKAILANQSIGITIEQQLEELKTQAEAELEKWKHRVELHHVDVLLQKAKRTSTIFIGMDGIEAGWLLNLMISTVPKLKRRAQELLELLKEGEKKNE